MSFFDEEPVDEHAECEWEIHALKKQVKQLRLAITRFLHGANKTPPWESAGAVWASLLGELNRAICPEEKEGK